MLKCISSTHRHFVSSVPVTIFYFTAFLSFFSSLSRRCTFPPFALNGVISPKWLLSTKTVATLGDFRERSAALPLSRGSSLTEIVSLSSSRCGNNYHVCGISFFSPHSYEACVGFQFRKPLTFRRGLQKMSQLVQYVCVCTPHFGFQTCLCLGCAEPV